MYPVELPEIRIQATKFAPESQEELQRVVLEKAASMAGCPMIGSLVKEAMQWFHVQGLDEGFQPPQEDHAASKGKHHSKGKSRKKGKKSSMDHNPSDEKLEKKSSMKTAEDVINRIQWDDNLPSEAFCVGYLDRFLGIMEKSFEAFSWEDISSVDYNVLAIPKHRIQYFKYQDLKVWDKASRLDNVFGSTGSGLSITDVMDRYNELKAEQEPEDAHSSPKTSQQSKTKNKKSTAHTVGAAAAVAAYLSNTSDDEDDVHIDLGGGSRQDSCNPYSELNLDDDFEDTTDPYWQNKLRPTHFLCIRVTDPEIVEGVEGAHSSILEMEPRYAECCIRPSALHITICTLGLDTVEQTASACNLLRDSGAELEEMAKNITLTIHEVDNFYNRVLYAKVHHEQDFTDFVNYVKLLYQEQGLHIRDNYEFVPHMTLMKTTRPVSREMRTSKFDGSLYAGFEDMYFGKQAIDGLYLCEMNSDRDIKGFYISPAQVEFSKGADS